jgi:hypothetical protein
MQEVAVGLIWGPVGGNKECIQNFDLKISWEENSWNREANWTIK